MAKLADVYDDSTGLFHNGVTTWPRTERRAAMTFENLAGKISREIAKGYSKVRAHKGVRELRPEWPDDFSDFTKNLRRQVLTCTLTSKERVASLERAICYLHEYDIAGDFVECGVAAGGSVMVMASRCRILASRIDASGYLTPSRVCRSQPSMIKAGSIRRR